MSVLYLDTLDDSRLDVFARLTEAQLRNKLEPEKGIFIAESFKVVARALDAGYEPVACLMQEKWLETAQQTIERIDPDIPTFILPQEQMERLTGFPLTRGILAAFRRPTLPSLDEVLEGASRVAVLENIVDHTNVGAMFRSAAALGMDAVLVTPRCCDPLYRRAVRVSMGTVFQVPWTRIGSQLSDWPDVGLQMLHDRGFQTAAMALSDDSISIDSPVLSGIPKLALVLGTEGDGLAPATIAHCTHTVRIPMHNHVDSLNVAAASAVAFWQLRQQQS